MVVDFNPIEYFANIFDIVEFVKLEENQLTNYAFERKQVTAEFNDKDMMYIKLDDIAYIDNKYVQTFKLTCSKCKLDLCKQIIAETQLDVEYLPFVDNNSDLLDVIFYIKEDSISTEIEAK